MTDLKKPYELSDDEAKQFCLNHYESTIDTSGDFNVKYHWWIYEETSADGYTIWIAKYEDGPVYPSESVYYHPDGLYDLIWECLRTGCTLRISDIDYDELNSKGLFDWQEEYKILYNELYDEEIEN